MYNVELLHQLFRNVVENIQNPYGDIVRQVLSRREVIWVDIETLELPCLGSFLSEFQEPASAQDDGANRSVE